MITALEALERLREGNERFASNVRRLGSPLSRMRRGDLTTGQEPFAIILGCSDSRVPTEPVFDQGLGRIGNPTVFFHVLVGSVVESLPPVLGWFWMSTDASSGLLPRMRDFRGRVVVEKRSPGMGRAVAAGDGGAGVDAVEEHQ